MTVYSPLSFLAPWDVPLALLLSPLAAPLYTDLEAGDSLKCDDVDGRMSLDGLQAGAVEVHQLLYCHGVSVRA